MKLLGPRPTNVTHAETQVHEQELTEILQLRTLGSENTLLEMQTLENPLGGKHQARFLNHHFIPSHFLTERCGDSIDFKMISNDFEWVSKRLLKTSINISNRYKYIVF